MQNWPVEFDALTTEEKQLLESLTSTVCLSSIAGSPMNTRTLVEKSFCSALIFYL